MNLSLPQLLIQQQQTPSIAQQFTLPPPPLMINLTPPKLDINSYSLYFQTKNLRLINGQQQYLSGVEQVQKKLKNKYNNCEQIQQDLNNQQQKNERMFNITLLTKCQRCFNWIQNAQIKIHMTFHAAIILDNLFLGDKFSCQSKKQLIQRLKVTHVVNAATEIINYFQKQGIKYLNLDLLDNMSEDVIQPCLKAAEFINQAVTQNPHHKVFVHCAMGKSRSVSAIMIYLIQYKKMTVDQSLKLIRQKRNLAKPNVNYMQQLYQFEKNLEKYIS